MKPIWNILTIPDDLLEDFCDGEESFVLLPLVCNPLGTHTKKHKLGIVLFTLGNKYRSTLRTINLVACAVHPLIVKHGIDCILFFKILFRRENCISRKLLLFSSALHTYIHEHNIKLINN